MNHPPNLNLQLSGTHTSLGVIMFFCYLIRFDDAGPASISTELEDSSFHIR